MFNLKSLLFGGGSKKESPVPIPPKNVKQKTKETAQKLSQVINDDSLETFSKTATDVEILGAVYKMMVKVQTDDKLREEQLDNHVKEKQIAAEKRHKEIIDALSTLTFGKGKKPKEEKELKEESLGETAPLPDMKNVIPKGAPKVPKGAGQTPKVPKTKGASPEKVAKETKGAPQKVPKTTKETPVPSTTPPKVSGTPPVTGGVGTAGKVAIGAATVGVGMLPIDASAKVQDRNQSMVYNSFVNAGFSKNQSVALTAEVGRENAYANYALFGQHSDPENRESNLGFFSWQKERKAKLISHMRSKNLVVKDEQGRINFEESQKSLDAQAEFAKNEMISEKRFEKTRELFLNNPDIDSETAAQVLGKDYIKWRYDDPKFESGHRNRRLFEMQIKRKVEQSIPPEQQRSDLGRGLDAISKENNALNEKMSDVSPSNTVVNQNNYNMFQPQHRPQQQTGDDRSAYERKSRAG